MVDQVEIKVQGGRGGDGSSSFHREKYVPKGPPDGGDGGKGGSIYLLGDVNLTSLYDFHSTQSFGAEKGGNGSRNDRHGKNGVDLILKVPLGTEVRVVAEASNVVQTLSSVIPSPSGLRSLRVEDLTGNPG